MTTRSGSIPRAREAIFHETKKRQALGGARGFPFRRPLRSPPQVARPVSRSAARLRAAALNFPSLSDSPSKRAESFRLAPLSSATPGLSRAKSIAGGLGSGGLGDWWLNLCPREKRIEIRLPHRPLAQTEREQARRRDGRGRSDGRNAAGPGRSPGRREPRCRGGSGRGRGNRYPLRATCFTQASTCSRRSRLANFLNRDRPKDATPSGRR